jgi:hypothetical protein
MVTDRKVKETIRLSKRTDNLKNRVSDLKLSWVYETLLHPCYYCGTIDEPRGLDRKDNDLGHTMDNCIPCCAVCNLTRGNRFTVDEMEEIGQVIAKIRLSRK